MCGRCGLTLSRGVFLVADHLSSYHDVTMRERIGLILAALVLLLTEPVTARMLRDFSGDPMQQHSSRMLDSPMNRIPGLLGLSLWPLNPYYYAPPSLTVVHVDIHFPPGDRPSAPTVEPAPSIGPIFWTNRCGVFVKMEVSPTSNLVEEEQKPCEGRQ
jgi:hypothetical protein